MASEKSFPGRAVRRGKQQLKKSLQPVAAKLLPTMNRIARSPQPPAPAPKPAPAPAPKPAAGDSAAFIEAYRGLERVFPEAGTAGNGKGRQAPSSSSVVGKIAHAKRVRANAVLAQALAEGLPVETSVIRAVRAMIDNGDIAGSVAIGHALSSRPGTAALGQAVRGLTALATAGPERAWTEFGTLQGTDWIEHFPAEYFSAAYGTDPEQAAPEVSGCVDDGSVHRWSTVDVLRVARKSFAHGEIGVAKALNTVGFARPDAEIGTHVRSQLERLATWFPGGKRRQPISTEPDTIHFGILDYLQPDLSSRNIGDYIQTLASLGHLVRHQNFEFTGRPEVVDFMGQIRSTVKDERRLDTPAARFSLIEAYRDGSTLQEIPEQTWIFAFGWYMHSIFGRHDNFPFHENIRPIFISFHVNKPDMLTPAAVAYLQKYGPVGCRDWQTVALLRAASVPAFFSGCLTTTVDTVYRRDGEDGRTKTVYVDAEKKGTGDSRTQAQSRVRDLSFVENLELAREWVGNYHQTYKSVVTSRLHCFLPSRSVGSAVTFVPKNRSDVRFGGLIDTSDAQFDAIRTGILDKLAETTTLIASGADEETVYNRWRELCAPDMAVADGYLADYPDLTLAADLVGPLAAAALESPEPSAPRENVVDVVLDVRAGDAGRVPTVIRSMRAHSSATLRLWLTGESIPSQDREAISTAADDVTIVWLNLHRSQLREHAPTLEAATIPELLPALAADAMAGVSRAIFLTASSLVRGDISELLHTELQDSYLAARADQQRGRHSGFAMLRRVSSRQGADAARAMEFIARSHAMQHFDFATFDTNVMVVDLEMVRRDRLFAVMAPLMARFGMTFREALNAAVGPRRIELDAPWNFAPQYDGRTEAKVVNWRDGAKPWGTGFVPFADEWRIAAQLPQR